MAELIELNTFRDERGALTVLESLENIGFDIKRLFYIYDVPPGAERGGHRHITTSLALICLAGACDVYVDNGSSERTFHLDSPGKCLVLQPEDWHTMTNFSAGAVLLAAASQHYDRNDYIHEGYR